MHQTMHTVSLRPSGVAGVCRASVHVATFVSVPEPVDIYGRGARQVAGGVASACQAAYGSRCISRESLQRKSLWPGADYI